MLRPELCSWAVIRIGRWAANSASAQGVRIPAFVGCGLASLVSHMEDATSQLWVSPGLVLGTQDSEGKPESISRFC